MSKDQAVGTIILLICAVLAILYTLTLFFPAWLGLLGISIADAEIRFWTIAIPVFLVFVAIMGIGAWIGWTMATTPPPKPIEETISEIETETAEEKSE